MGVNYNFTQNYGQSWKNTAERLYPVPLLCVYYVFPSSKTLHSSYSLDMSGVRRSHSIQGAA